MDANKGPADNPTHQAISILPKAIWISSSVEILDIKEQITIPIIPQAKPCIALNKKLIIMNKLKEGIKLKKPYNITQDASMKVEYIKCKFFQIVL